RFPRCLEDGLLSQHCDGRYQPGAADSEEHDLAPNGYSAIPSLSGVLVAGGQAAPMNASAKAGSARSTPMTICNFHLDLGRSRPAESLGGAERRRRRLSFDTHEAEPLASGKKSCAPLILYPAMVRCPSGEVSQSMNFSPRSRLTRGCFCGLTSMTPYWLKSRRSPSTTTLRFCLFLKLSHVPRSDSV